jgi:predicted nucleic acid-binding protein
MPTGVGMKYIYDTNIWIDYFSDEDTVIPWFTEEFLSNNQVIISTIIRMELLCFSGLSAKEEARIKECLEQFESIFINSQIEAMTIKIRKQHKVKLPDAIIASTALVEGAILVTRNTDDFKGVTNLIIINPFTN